MATFRGSSCCSSWPDPLVSVETAGQGHRAPRGGGGGSVRCVVVLARVLDPGDADRPRTLPLHGWHWLAWPGYLWLALMFYLLVTLVVLELPRVRALRGWHRGGACATGVDAAEPTPWRAARRRRCRVAAGDAGPTRPPEPAPRRRRTTTPPGGCCWRAGRRSSPGSPPPVSPAYGVRTAMGPPQLDRVQIRWPSCPAAWTACDRPRLRHPPRAAARHGRTPTDRRA